MPSVRVRRTLYQDPSNASDSGRAAGTGNLDLPPAGRPRSRTLASLFSSGSAPIDVTSSAPTSNPPTVRLRDPQSQLSPQAGATQDVDLGYEPDLDNPKDRRGMIFQSFARNRAATIATRGSLAAPGSPKGRSRGHSVVSSAVGEDGVTVQLGNLEGAVASAVSLASHNRDDLREQTAARNTQLEQEDDSDSDYTTDGSEADEEEHHLDDVVNHLEVIDPQVAVVSHLSNAANSILIPRLPIYSRRPVVTLPTLTPTGTVDSLPLTGEPEKADGKRHKKRKHHKNRDDLDAHVEHVLKRRQKLRRTLKGIWQFLKTPTGIVTAIYGFLVAFWGAAIVLFLVKWINVHNSETQKFWIEISSQIENALFTVTGVGLIPWRVMDTYRIYRIWHYRRLSHRLRKRQNLPPLENEDDLPDPELDPTFVHVLTDKQQRDLRRQQKRFQKSQTWYRPHATDTHKAFPIKTALLICLLVDGNSIFQCFLCGTMWGLSRYDRPPWTTGLLIPASFLCGIFAAIFIGRGGAKSKKTAEVEERLRVALDMNSSSDTQGLMDDFHDQNNIEHPTPDHHPTDSPHSENAIPLATQITTFGT